MWPPRSYSLLVPTLNEADTLPAFFQQAQQLTPAPLEILVCDAGSTDATGALAVQAGATVVTAPKGRGRQIAAGARVARGDVLLIAHADMHIENDVPRRILDVLEQHPNAPGGAIGSRFEPASPFLRVITRLNNLRARWAGVSFGDQGQFVRRSQLEALGGFPDMELMEDVELSYRMKGRGHPLFLGGGIRVSSRRWRSAKPLRHALLIVYLVALYSAKRKWQRGPVDVRPFYERYYGSTLESWPECSERPGPEAVNRSDGRSAHLR